jgi:hypothetical protein
MPTKSPKDCLQIWLALKWDRPERSYNPDVRDFLADLLGYSRSSVVTEDSSGGGFPDIKLMTPEGHCWVVGDLKKDDVRLTSDLDRMRLWDEKRKYVAGLTRYVLFLTPRFIWLALPDGEPAEGFARPVDLRSAARAELSALLAPISFEAARHDRQWSVFVAGKLPYAYLRLTEVSGQSHLRRDLQESFQELTQAGDGAMRKLSKEHEEYTRLREDVDRKLEHEPGPRRRAINRLDNEYEPCRRIFNEVLPSFEEQYGRELEVKNPVDQLVRIKEAFIADSVAAMVARILFLRLVEDLGLTRKRRLSNGGPSNWSAFVEELASDAQALVRIAAEDVGRVYREPFQRSVFDWIHHTDGILDQAVQRLILRLNAYNFSTLSEEILGEIYQQFLPPAKRKRLGEFYTPASIVDWLLAETVRAHGGGTLLDPACGSGSFLVREVHARVENAKLRGLDAPDVVDTILREVWGFDLNPFAAFITHFQVMWALLRFGRPASDLPIQVHNLNSLLRDTDIARVLSSEHLPKGSVARDTKQWKYIVGNPPYIRAERVKYGSEMQHLWSSVWGQNSDTGLLFLHQSIAEWLEQGGWIGMVVSGGYANSEAAAPVWRLLNPGGSASLRKLVWLEFAGKLWDPNVIPMLLVIEKKPANDDDLVELYVPPAWPSSCDPAVVRYADLFDARTSPALPSEGSRWGAYLLPLLQPADVPIIQKLYPFEPGRKTLGHVVQSRGTNGRAPSWTYGIQRGGVDVTDGPFGKEPVAVIGGRDISAACFGAPEQWVDLESVKERPYGKLSLWAGHRPAVFIAVNELGLGPTAAVVRSDPGSPIAALNSVVVAEPDPGGPPAESVAAFLNSSIVRFYWAVRLRSGVLEGSSRSHFYPRTIESIPWPKTLMAADLGALAGLYMELSSLAQIARDNPDEWLLSYLAELPPSQCIKLAADVAGLTFGAWMDPKAGEIELSGNRLSSGLSWFEVADNDVAEIVAKILARDPDDFITRSTVQRLIVPRDWAKTMEEYRSRSDAFSAVRSSFHATLQAIDKLIYRAFGVTKQEQAHVERRLSSFPLNRLVPRYPWAAVKPRPLKAYTEDRFAQ